MKKGFLSLAVSILLSIGLSFVCFAEDDDMIIFSSVPSQYTVTVNSSVGGSFSVEDNWYSGQEKFPVERFQSFTVTAEPDHGYQLLSIKSSNAHAGITDGNCITFSSVLTDLTIDISFADENEPPKIISSSMDCVVAKGASKQIMVEHECLHSVSYLWEVSKDAGVTWTVAAGENKNSVYEIQNAQPNDCDPAQYYIYKATVTSANGETATDRTKVLVSDDYSYCKMAQQGKDVTVSSYIHKESELEITPVSNAEGQNRKLLAEASPELVPVIMCDVAMRNADSGTKPYFGDIVLEFDVGDGYNGQTLNVMHYHGNEQAKSHSGVVRNGKLTVTVDSLSFFVVEAPEKAMHQVLVESCFDGVTVAHETILAEDQTDVLLNFTQFKKFTVGRITIDGEEVYTDGKSYMIQQINSDKSIRVEFVRSQFYLHGVMILFLFVAAVLNLIIFLIRRKVKQRR